MLTKKEKEIYRLVGENGYSLNELADLLVLSRATCKTHYGNICRKLDLSGSARGEKLVARYWKDKLDYERENVRPWHEIINRLKILTEKYNNTKLDSQQKLLVYGIINGLLYALKMEGGITEVGVNNQ